MRFAILLAVLIALCSVSLALKNSTCAPPEKYEGQKCVYVSIPKWSYHKRRNECVYWVRKICNGDKNIFKDKKECEETCKKTVQLAEVDQ
ncbi:male accessory gland serine protease inhibitor-like [Drosophila busckii]|uniref:male accessory gland serine protease inhibitor-like n=1 Tax=Drosophila busckii TaxID=30019 RepID=UPI00083F0DAF|nr:male accessory gland serine protease inhibitor-like [Drosophila busckii]